MSENQLVSSNKTLYQICTVGR